MVFKHPLKNTLDKSEFNQDSELLKETYNKINDLCSQKETITISDLELIDYNIKYLDQKYDSLNDLLYLYDPIQVSYKKEIHKKQVEELREESRKKVNNMNNQNKKESYKLICEIQVAFARLIGPLSIMSVLDSYEEKQCEIKDILNTITQWAAKFELEQNLNFITSKELLNIYERLEKLKDKFLFDNSLGNESELSDEIVIWMWEIMTLRKKQLK